jgi:hypothetical protein
MELVAGPLVQVAMSFEVWGHRHPPLEIYGTRGSLAVPNPNRFDGVVELLKVDGRGSRSGGAWLCPGRAARHRGRPHGSCAVRLEHGTAAFADPALHGLDLTVPIITMSTIAEDELADLVAAVEGGVGLGGDHGGIGDSFRREPAYHFMVGGQWVAYPGNIIDDRVEVIRLDDPIMAGIGSFSPPLRAVLHGSRPGQRGAGDDHLLGRALRLSQGRRDARGVAAAARQGLGVLQLARPFRRGLVWAARRS